MTVLAVTIASPHPGKRAAAEARARQYAGILARHGARVKLSNIISGPNTGCIALLRTYADFRTATTAFQAIQSDPANAEFWRERESNPVADLVMVRDLMRVVYGEQQWETHPVSLVRQYDMTRDKLAQALELLDEIRPLAENADTNLVGIVPVTGANMSSFSVSYQFRSQDHAGEAFDDVGTSPEFQAIVAKAHEVGTLSSAFILNPL